MDVWLVSAIVAVAVYVTLLASSFMHEAGHSVAAALCGWRTLEIRVGDGWVVKTVRVGDLEISWRLIPISGWYQISMTDASRWKRLAVYLGGPLVSLSVAGGLLAAYVCLPPEGPRWLSTVVFWLVVFHGLSLLCCWIPHTLLVEGMEWANDTRLAMRSVTMPRKALERHVHESVFQTAQTFLRRGEIERARSFYEKFAAEFDGKDMCDVRLAGVYFLMASGTPEEVRQAKEALLNDAETSGYSLAEALDSLACIPIFHGYPDLLDESLGYIDRAIQMKPGAITLQGTKSSILIELGRWEEGLALLDEVAKVTASENDRAITSYYRALAVWKSGDTKTAWKLLREAIRAYPACPVRVRMEKRFWNDRE